jgi:hypothetical protein
LKVRVSHETGKKLERRKKRRLWEMKIASRVIVLGFQKVPSLA